MSKTQEAQQSIDRATMREYWRVNRSVVMLADYMEEWDNLGHIITEVRVRGPEATRDGYMAVIKGIDDSRKGFVAFRSAGSPKELLLKITDDLEAGRLIFKEEQAYDPDGAKARAKAGKEEKA